MGSGSIAVARDPVKGSRIIGAPIGPFRPASRRGAPKLFQRAFRSSRPMSVPSSAAEPASGATCDATSGATADATSGPTSEFPVDRRRDALEVWLRSLAPRHALDVDRLAPASADASFRRYFRAPRRRRHDDRDGRAAGPRGLGRVRPRRGPDGRRRRERAAHRRAGSRAGLPAADRPRHDDLPVGARRRGAGRGGIADVATRWTR